MTLLDAKISDGALHAFVDGCTVLQSLLLPDNYGFRQLQVVSPSLRSIGVRTCFRFPVCLQRFIVVGTPCMERLLIFKGIFMDISVISAPRLRILGNRLITLPGMSFRNTVFQV